MSKMRINLCERGKTGWWFLPALAVLAAMVLHGCGGTGNTGALGGGGVNGGGTSGGSSSSTTTASVHGQLRDANGDPVTGATVEATVNGEVVRTATTSADGSFTLSGLPPGSEVTLTYEKGGQTLGSTTVASLTAGQSREIGTIPLPNQPPLISSITVLPESGVLDVGGGPITITVTTSDFEGDALTATAQIKKPDGSTETITLENQEGGIYSGTYRAPANTGTTDLTYELSVTVTDAAHASQAATPAGSVKVMSPTAPPLPPPPFGGLLMRERAKAGLPSKAGAGRGLGRH